MSLSCSPSPRPSSEASYPKILDQLERFGVSKKIASFVLPLGYSFNLDGTMAYCTFATMFIAQAYGVDMPISKQIAMAAVLMLTSKGVAGVPRASLVVILATLKQFGIPEAGLLLILGIDQFLDMGRSATNVIGNSLAAAVVAKFENDLGPAKDDGVAPVGVPAHSLNHEGDHRIRRLAPGADRVTGPGRGYGGRRFDDGARRERRHDTGRAYGHLAEGP